MKHKQIQQQKCKHCLEHFEYTDEDICYDNNGYGYSTKIIKCPKCGKLNILQYLYDHIDINNDCRYYKY